MLVVYISHVETEIYVSPQATDLLWLLHTAVKE